jgi:hypothetical protein
MSGTKGAYDPLRRTQREVDGQRDANSPRNYDALRQTQQEVDALPTPTPQQPPAARNPYENADERQADNSQRLDAKVEEGRISQSEKIYRERQFDNQLVAEQKLHDQRLAKARELADAAKAQNAQQQQREMASTREMARDRD